MNTINCANDDNLKERFENAWRKRQVNEGYYNSFDPENKEHAKIYNMFLEAYKEITDHCGAAEKYELIPSIMEQLAEDIRNDNGRGSLEYLAESIDVEKIDGKIIKTSTKELLKTIDPSGKTAKETGDIKGVEKYSLIDKGSALNKEAIGDDKAIEAMQKELSRIENKIALLCQKKRNLEASNPLNDVKDLQKEIMILKNQQERIIKSLAKYDKDSQKINLK